MNHGEVLWIYNKYEDSEVEELSRRLGISRLLAKVFLSRGIRDGEYIGKFLNPSIESLHDPFLLRDMDRAVERVARAVKSGEKILIYGDYDVDGITSTSMLYDFLSGLGAQVEYYIPDRFEDGYGLSAGAIEKFIARRPSLVITVDCGITSVDEVEMLKENGMDVVIADHHECREMLPAAWAVVNPNRPDCSYPFRELAGVGVVYKLICGICARLGLGDAHLRYLDLVALGTVADVVSLTDENRVVVKYGLEMLQGTVRPGLKALIEVSGLKNKKIDSWSIGFVLAPRINAAGRMGDASRAVRLLTTRDKEEAYKIAAELNEENRYRQEVENDILNQASGIIDSDESLKKSRVLVVAGEGWHEGIIGIVASKLMERYYKPVILISVEGEYGKGSGRSPEGFNLFKALCSCGQLLERFGGHEFAAGLSIRADMIDGFRQAVNSYADSVTEGKELVPSLKIDVVLDKEDITVENVRELELLSPFGAGNPSPVFAYRRIGVRDIRTVGDNRHLKMTLQDGEFCIDAIGFNMGDLCRNFGEADLLDVACSLQINSWNNAETVQLNLKCIKLCEEWLEKNRFYYMLDKSIVFKDTNDYNKDITNVTKVLSFEDIDGLIPERSDLAALYRYLRAAGGLPVRIDDLFSFSRRISRSLRLDFNFFKLKKSLEIFQELGLTENEPYGEYGMIVKFNQGARKTDLEKSVLYKTLQGLKNRCAEAKRVAEAK